MNANAKRALDNIGVDYQTHKEGLYEYDTVIIEQESYSVKVSDKSEKANFYSQRYLEFFLMNLFRK